MLYAAFFVDNFLYENVCKTKTKVLSLNQHLTITKMGYRINERNIGDHTLEGGAKRRKTAKAKLSEQEIELAKAVLQRVYDCLQFDKDLSERGHLHDDSVWTDGGRFIISLTGKQKNDLFDIIHERKF